MLLGSVRSLVLRSSSSWSNLPLGIARGSRVCSSLCVPAENTKHSVTDLALNSVVKVFCCSSEFSVLQPWQKRPSHTGTGSGFVISRNKILTNAHVVSDHTFVQVRKHGSSEKYKAKVEAIGHECDLAILKIDSKKFWENMKPLELGDIPALQQTVSVVGYPEGGDNIAITKGVVSRVEVTKYSHGGNNLVTVQIDAAINKGNSGGPVVMENKVVGVAFQGLASAENSGYIIPTPVIKHFITGVEKKGQFVGFCSLGITCQSMENSRFRYHYKMSPEMTGIRIKKINPLSSAYSSLKKDDILLSIDGVSIGNDATVPLRNTEAINFNHLVSMKKPGETALVKVLREGKQHEFNIKLNPVEPLIPLHLFDKVPSYYIFAGLVFSPLTKPYMDCCKMYKSLLQRMPKKAGEQVVIISRVLEDDINVGYPSLEDLLVKKVNGVEVENLKHLSQLIENCCTEDLKLDFTDDDALVIDYKSAKKRNSKILKRYGIPSAMSKDLKVKSAV